jgi:hypothetical protein
MLQIRETEHHFRYRYLFAEARPQEVVHYRGGAVTQRDGGRHRLGRRRIECARHDRADIAAAAGENTASVVIGSSAGRRRIGQAFQQHGGEVVFGPPRRVDAFSNVAVVHQ